MCMLFNYMKKIKNIKTLYFCSSFYDQTYKLFRTPIILLYSRYVCNLEHMGRLERTHNETTCIYPNDTLSSFDAEFLVFSYYLLVTVYKNYKAFPF